MNFLRAISNLLRFDRTNWKALALCFFTAAIFWIFNALNKNYATNLRFPLQFEFDRTKYVAVDPLPATLTLNVSGNGWEIFRKSVGLKVPGIAMPLERPAETRKIIASALAPMAASQIGALQVNYVVTDTLRFRIEPRIVRKMKLLADLSGVSFKKNYGRTSPLVILPDSVQLAGPKSLIESMSGSVLLKVKASRIGENFRESVEVNVEQNELISRNPPVAEVMFEVGTMEEVERKIVLKTRRMPWATEVDRDSVTCRFLLPSKEHDRFLSDGSALSATFIFTDLVKGETRSFLPTLKGLPDYAEILHIDSVKVKKY